MTLFALALAFVLVWSALVWGCATSGLRRQDAYTDWPSFWRVHILVAVLPVIFVFIYAVLPPGLKSDLSFLQQLFAEKSTLAPAGIALVGDTPLLHPEQSFAFPLAVVVLSGYGAGVVYCLARFLIGKIRSAHIAADAAYHDGHGVWVTSRSVPPFAMGVGAGKIVFPQRLLAELTPDQAAMIIRHEQVHLDHGDPTWSDLFHTMRALFWFSPFIRDLINRWQVSVELRSDSVALTGEAPEARKAYAESLITALRMPAETAVNPAASFSNKHLRSEKMRIKNILRGEHGDGRPFRSNLQLLAAASALTLIGCTSAAGVSTAAADPEEKKNVSWVEEKELSWEHEGGEHSAGDRHKVFITKHGDGTMTKRHKIVWHKDGEVIERDYEDLTEAERAEIDQKLAQAEKEIERAMKEMDLAEEEIAFAEKEVKRVIKIHKENGDIEVDVEAEMDRAREEIEMAREELLRAREELEEKRERLAEED